VALEEEPLGADVGEPLAGGFARDRDVEGEDTELGDDSPAALGRDAPPPLATARAAAASAALADGRTGVGLLDGRGAAPLAGGGVAVVALEDAGDEAAREPDDGGVEEPRRLLPDPDEPLADEPLADELGDGLENAEPEDRPFAEPPFDAGGEAAGRDGVEGAGVVFTLVEPGDAATSLRASVGRTSVVSSPLPSAGPVDVAFGAASVDIGVVPPPGICRDVLSDRWLLSELTSHLHAQAADEKPSCDFYV
jgi:hypothetical protein